MKILEYALTAAIRQYNKENFLTGSYFASVSTSTISPADKTHYQTDVGIQEFLVCATYIGGNWANKNFTQRANAISSRNVKNARWGGLCTCWLKLYQLAVLVARNWVCDKTVW